MKEVVNQNYKRDTDREKFRECFVECVVKTGPGQGFKGRLDKRVIRSLREKGHEVVVEDEEKEAKPGDVFKDSKDK